MYYNRLGWSVSNDKFPKKTLWGFFGVI
jgi:hypothetical protein